LAVRKPPAEHQSTCGLAVVLSGGRRIEVQRNFDVHAFGQLVSVLERFYVNSLPRRTSLLPPA
jgi:hypothetical protein